MLNFNRNTNAGDVTLIVEAADAIANDATWNGIATNVDGAGWGSSNVTETGGGTPVGVSVSDPVSSASNRFLRVRVTKP